MKKKLLIFGSIVLVVVALSVGAYFGFLAGRGHHNDLTGFAQYYPYVENREIVPMQMNANGEFVVLQFTDTHLVNTRNREPDVRTLEMIEYWTARVNPDFVVITGDMLEGRAAQTHRYVDRHAALHGIAGIFEQLAQPWTFTPGNNDHEFMGSAQDVTAFLAYHYNYFLAASPAYLPGAVNFTLPILNEDNELAHKLIFIDSLGRHEIMQPEQAQWLSEQLLVLSDEAPQAQASIFFHYNTPMFYEAGYRFRGREGDTAIDEAILAADNVGLVSIGHTHPPENWLTNIDNMYLKVVRASGYRRGDEFPGAAVITIGSESYTFEEIVF